jgi:hypothetical protein
MGLEEPAHDSALPFLKVTSDAKGLYLTARLTLSACPFFFVPLLGILFPLRSKVIRDL